MNKLSFILAVMGLFVLVSFLLFGETRVEKYEDLEDLEINSKVVLSGFVEEEKSFGTFKILKINGIDVVCNCKGSYLNEKIIVEGYVSEYLGKKQVKVLSIKL